MSELLSQLMTPVVQAILIVFVVLLIIFYALSVYWALRDAQLRGSSWALGLLALIPFVGLVAYCLLRPQLLESDREEQDMGLALTRRQLMQYGDCGHCGYPVEADYILCPNCHQRLKNLCSTCHHALDPAWTVCPYCTTPVGGNRPH